MAKRRELLEGTDSEIEEAIRLTTRPWYMGRCISASATKCGNFAFDTHKMWEWFHCLTGGYRARARRVDLRHLLLTPILRAKLRCELSLICKH